MLRQKNCNDSQYKLHPAGMSRTEDVLKLVPFGRTTLWRWSKDGRFPAPVKISDGITAWRNSDVLAWLESHDSKVQEETKHAESN